MKNCITSGIVAPNTVKPLSLSNDQKIGFQDQLSLNAGQKYCRMLSALLLTFIKLPFVIKIFVLSIFNWPFYTGFTVPPNSGRSLFKSESPKSRCYIFFNAQLSLARISTLKNKYADNKVVSCFKTPRWRIYIFHANKCLSAELLLLCSSFSFKK